MFSFYLTPESKRRGPLVLGWFGSTGIGKTELAKALAKALYGSSDRLATISMGSISRAEQLNNIFGSSAGFVGSLEVREFEKALRKNPNGGVVAFDEFSNVGGNNKAEKDAIGKRFYELFEGKTWTSPVTGKEYDLTKYVFTLQGNDGEESFQDYQSEDMRMTIWKELKNSEAIRRILRERGFSEALIGRIADISLFKPTQAETNTKIVEKFLRIELEEFRSLGVDVQFDEAFAQKLTDIFFSYREGNRSVRKIIEKHIKGNVGKILSSALVENPNLDTANVKFSLDISDSFLGKYIIDAENRYEERKVILSIRSSLLQQDSNIDLTMQAVNCRLMTSEQARLVAAHEAGHAILNEPEVSGQRVAYVTIRGDGNLGYARYEDLPGGSNNHTVKSMLFALARLVAGQAGVAAVGKSEETGWSSDLSTARKLAYRVLISNGLLEPFLGIIHSDKKDSSHLSDTKREAVEDIITAYLKVSRELAAKVIQRNKGIFDRIADRLFQKGFMTGDDYQLMSDGRQGVTDEDYKEAEKQINDLLVPITQRLANSQPL